MLMLEWAAAAGAVTACSEAAPPLLLPQPNWI
jgi:hypothetical protein